MTVDTPKKSLIVDDVILIGIMAVLAGCGLIYEYLLSHYASRILGVVESTIYTMIGLMIVSMGFGSFAAKKIKDPFTSFAWLESIIAFFGVTCILIIAAAVSIGALLPEVIAEIYNLPPDLLPKGGVFAQLRSFTYFMPYFFGALIGFLIGMEIPLIARVREAVYGQHLEHNTGTIYGADYIGAGAGAAVWVLVMLSIDITKAAVLTAIVNLLAGLVFLYRYRKKIQGVSPILVVHFFIAMVAFSVYKYGDDWSSNMTNTLFQDEVVYSGSSHYQNFTITERYLRDETKPVYGFYINGRLQFSSEDEFIYHGMLVYPALTVAPLESKVLIIGGGDGLALRDVLGFNPQSVTLIDLDEEMIKLFTPQEGMPEYRRQLVELNKGVFLDPKVELIVGDAFVEVDNLLQKNAIYDAIIVDLPDPSHPDLDRLYSDHFYSRLKALLSSNGVLVAQSTSPYHAKKAFVSIGKTIEAVGFTNVEQYRQNIPSFGEWGWSIASNNGSSVRGYIGQTDELIVKHQWLTRDLLMAAFEFPEGFFKDRDAIEVNHLGSHRVYRYHDEAWRGDLGVYRN